MHLNDLSPAPGSKKPKTRVGRGAGSGLGKTAGRGQKGQKSRKSGGVRPGFEGGQLPLQIRVPKFGFRSRVGLGTAEVRLGELAKVPGELIDLQTLQAANVLPRSVKRVRIMLSGAIERAVTVKGIKVTRGARAAIEAAGGKVED
jgi:large subunit ribosomal protein L15